MGTGGDPWKPRLQRLADARQLAPFEKLVLELLVGCHVSPSVQRTFLANKPGSGMDEMTAMSPVTVIKNSIDERIKNSIDESITFLARKPSFGMT